MKFLIFCFRMWKAKRRAEQSFKRSIKMYKQLSAMLGYNGDHLGQAIALAHSQANRAISTLMECGGDGTLYAEKAFEWALAHPGLVKAQLEKMG